MDKKVIFAVVGSGKTTHIVSRLSNRKRSLIVTYTTANYENLRKKITEKFNGVWPASVTLMTYFSFLFGFCYKPFLSDKYKARGLIYEPNSNTFIRQTSLEYYMTKNRYLYSNRLALLLEKECVLNDIMMRIQTYFDEFIIDEVQDIADHIVLLEDGKVFATFSKDEAEKEGLTIVEKMKSLYSEV